MLRTKNYQTAQLERGGNTSNSFEIDRRSARWNAESEAITTIDSRDTQLVTLTKKKGAMDNDEATPGSTFSSTEHLTDSPVARHHCGIGNGIPTSYLIVPMVISPPDPSRLYSRTDR